MRETHECEQRCLDRGVMIRRLCLIVQRAMKQMTGYFAGYISKREPVGRFQLKLAARALPLLLNKLKKIPYSSQLAQLVNRMFAVLEGRGKLRTAAEEFNLAANHRNCDELNAEFISSFRTGSFPGIELLNRCEYERYPTTKKYQAYACSSRRHGAEATTHFYYSFVECYGFRPPVDSLLYLCPWEFCMWWEVLGESDH